MAHADGPPGAMQEPCRGRAGARSIWAFMLRPRAGRGFWAEAAVQRARLELCSRGWGGLLEGLLARRTQLCIEFSKRVVVSSLCLFF